jgi:hypothetical protein
LPMLGWRALRGIMLLWRPQDLLTIGRPLPATFAK